MLGLKIDSGNPLVSLTIMCSARALVYVYVLGRPSRREGRISSSCSSLIHLWTKGCGECGEGGVCGEEGECGEGEEICKVRVKLLGLSGQIERTNCCTDY